MFNKMFRKMKLRPYLITIFSIIILMAAVITGSSGWGLHRIKSGMELLVDHTITAELALERSRVNANVAARSLSEMVVPQNSAQIENLENQMDKSVQEISKQLEILKSVYGTEDGFVDQYEKAINNWYAVAAKAGDQMKRGESEQALRTVLNESGPAIEALTTVTKQFDEKLATLRQEAEAEIHQMMVIFIVVSTITFVLVLVVSLMFAFKTTHRITSAVDQVKASINELSKGNLSAKMEYEAENEFGELANGINFSLEELSKYVNAIDYGMEEFAKGNFACECPITFVGDFANIQHSIDEFQEKINDTLSQLRLSAEQVEMGASQVADGAQQLAQGATEQASSSEELSAAIAEISDQLSHTAEYSEKANKLGKDAGVLVQQSQTEMKQMVAAMKEIAQASEGIQRIIKTIDDIAFQTNILALNAAVEAARAGTAGKGFAVVADEVRALAQKSAEAAKNTTGLIEESLRAVQNGTQLAVKTETAFDEVAKNAEDVLGMVHKIAEATGEQSASVSQITIGVDQISSVIQMNSASSEESAAASEELNGQADMMKSLLEKFQLMN